MPQLMGRLSIGAAAPAPAGLAEFCAASVETCGSLDLKGALDTGAPTGAAWIGASGDDRRGEALFQALLARVRAPGVRSAPSGGVIALTSARWGQLARVNRDVNWAIAPANDAEIYGREEVWAMPLSHPSPHARRRGDCEDYVLEKRERLLALGWPSAALSIATALAPGQGMHAVLIVHSDRGDVVLDNLAEAPQPVEALAYVWVAEQSGADLMAWSNIATGFEEVSPNAPARPGSPRSPEQTFAALLQDRGARARAERALTFAQAAAAEPLIDDAWLSDKELKAPPSIPLAAFTSPEDNQGSLGKPRLVKAPRQSAKSAAIAGV